MSNQGDGDKRTVATDALLTLGTIIDASQKRDAIHLAVEPVVAAVTLHPGQHVIVRNGTAYAAMEDDGLGIVDPFLAHDVRKGQRFWFVMYPRQVHSLRHVWTHPAFPDAEAAPVRSDAVDRSAAEKWLRDYADTINVGFRDLVDSARFYIEDGEYMSRGGTLEGMSTSEEFWDHYQTFTGHVVPADKRANFFSCSC